MYKYQKYIEKVEKGNIRACKFVLLAIQRFKNLLQDTRFTFDIKKVERVISFFALLKHATGKHAGKPFLLEEWQEFIIAYIYGFYWKESKERLITSVYIEMARKQGKTAFAAALCLYHEIADGEKGAEVYLTANSKDQAKVAFTMCKNFANSIDKKGRLLSVFRDYITFDCTKSILKVLASDSTKLDGPNPSMFLLDEYHASKTSDLKNVMQSGMGMRENPMQIVITTAGFDKLSPCYEMRDMCIDVLNGLKQDDSLFSIIYTLDEGDDWRDEKQWIKSNPNLGVTVKTKYLKDQINLAKNNPSEEVGIKTKNINIWCDSSDTWIADERINNTMTKINLERFEGYDAYLGIDLSAVSDLTAVSCMIPTTDKLYFFNRYYLPQMALTEKRHKELYQDWQRRGAIKITPGNVVDYDFVLNDIKDMGAKVLIQKIAYDSWNSTQFAINATEQGLPMEAFSQSLGNFNKPTKELERLILSDKVEIEYNIINRHCFRNVEMARDRNGNIKPSKQHDEKKIDGVIAMIQALGVYLSEPRYSNII